MGGMSSPADCLGQMMLLNVELLVAQLVLKQLRLQSSVESIYWESRNPRYPEQTALSLELELCAIYLICSFDLFER